VNQQTFSTGWDEERRRKVLGHYEVQTDEEATAEDEAAFQDRAQIFIEIPNDLVTEIRSLFAKRHTSLMAERVDHAPARIAQFRIEA
jgi:hypothetical protein